MVIMRTTIAIDDELLAAARRRAGAEGLTLGQLVERALRREFQHQDRRAEGPPVPVFKGGAGPHPGIDLRSNRALSEVLDEGVALDRHR
jgi:hypothetical protein